MLDRMSQPPSAHDADVIARTAGALALAALTEALLEHETVTGDQVRTLVEAGRRHSRQGLQRASLPAPDPAGPPARQPSAVAEPTATPGQ
jgi:hypothetical protein